MSEIRPSVLLCAGPCRPDDHGGPRRAMPNHAICDVCEERCWESLHWLADHWQDLEVQLTRPESHAASGMPKGGRDGTGIELNEAVADLRHQLDAALHHWVHVLLDEAPGFKGPKSEPVTMARYLAMHHKRITRMTDGAIAADFTCAVADMRRQMRRRAFPSGARLYDPELPCAEHSTSDLGERIPCPGRYVTWVTDRMDGTPDLVCTEDENHVLTPAEFRRAGRRTVKAAAAATMLEAIIGTA